MHHQLITDAIRRQRGEGLGLQICVVQQTRLSDGDPFGSCSWEVARLASFLLSPRPLPPLLPFSTFLPSS